MRIKWTDEHTEFLKKYYIQNGVAWCAKQLETTAGAVYHRASKLGIGKNGVDRFRLTENEGYPMIAFGDKRMYLHRIVAEMIIGRELTSDDIIHHKDENKWNCNPDNIEVVSRSTHMKIHVKERDELGRFVG